MDLSAWLQHHGLADLGPVFERNAVTIDLLPHLSEDDLREMGLALGHRKKVLMALQSDSTSSEAPDGLAVPAVAPTPALAPEPVPAPPRVTPPVHHEPELPPASWTGMPVRKLKPPPKTGSKPVASPTPQPRQPEPEPQRPAATVTPVDSPIPVVTVRTPVLAPVRKPVIVAPKATEPGVAAVQIPVMATGKRGKRRGFSMAFLVGSIALHLGFGLIAGYLVVQTITAKRKAQFSSAPPSPSPSRRAVEHKVTMQKRKNAGGAPAQTRRIAVSGLAASVTLPDMPVMPGATMPVLTGGSMSGMGGQGFGAGLGFGSGSGMGVGGMSRGGLGLTMFGTRTASGGLPGTFYDLKQTAKGEPSGITENNYFAEIQKWVKGGLQESFMQNYFKAPAKLYATQFLFPSMDASEAPKAYGVQKSVKPAQWVAHYKGKVSPPLSGTYQFVGAADDVLVVFYDGKLVFDGSWANDLCGLKPESIDPEGAYGNHMRKGYVRGDFFKANAGQWYDIDVIIGERPGGFFWAALCIEQKGQHDRSLFRLSSGKLPKMENPPLFKDNGPVWRAMAPSGSSNPLDLIKPANTP